MYKMTTISCLPSWHFWVT